MPRHHGQIVINTEGVCFASEQAAARFGLYLAKLGLRVRRLQVITAAEKQSRSILRLDKKSQVELPRFELLMSKH